MRIAFRVDASSQIGTGHFMRCLTLATELKKQGNHIRFMSRHLPDNFRKALIEKDIELIQLRVDPMGKVIDELAHSHWLGVSQTQDARDSVIALADQYWDWLIVDHYALDMRWESSLRKAVHKILVIDDIADRPHDCDVLLDQNYYTEMSIRYAGRVPGDCRLLLGPHYALLREEFYKMRQQIKVHSGLVRRVLIFFGGIDAGNYTFFAIKALMELRSFGLDVDVVIGPQHPHRTEIEVLCAEHNYICHIQTNRMAELMATADLAVGAGGSATWERCCLGLPALTICVADNQRALINDSAENGVMYAPLVSEDLKGFFKRHIVALLENPQLLKSISNTSQRMVDGKGSIRVASILMQSKIQLRRVVASDSHNLFRWRNHQEIRVVSRNSEPIEWAVHEEWLTAVMSDRDKVMLIGYIDDQPIGVVRFDKDKDLAEISIYLVPEGDVVGFGKALLLNAEQWLRINCPDIRLIRAVVLKKNTVSKQFFLKADYQPDTIFYIKELWGLR
jgi:UDP-2,4-diacetamido-2,4,6-trideoxy-beta-L-altropyranose hydrolase